MARGRRNVYRATRADFVRADPPEREPDHVSKSGSSYWYTDEGMYRLSEEYGLKSGKLKQLDREVSASIDRDVERIQGDFERDVNVAHAEHERELAQARTEADRRRADERLTEALTDAKASLDEAVTTLVEETAKTQSVEATRKMETIKAEERKSNVEDTVRAHLRGFARTIPSFIMAYGDRDLTLANFDEYTEPDVFRKVTGITLDDFRFLRDGGDYTDEKAWSITSMATSSTRRCSTTP